jgi:hypothetical protein
MLYHTRFPALSRVFIRRVDRTESAIAEKNEWDGRTGTKKSDIFILFISSTARFRAANLSCCITLSVVHTKIKQSLSNHVPLYVGWH